MAELAAAGPQWLRLMGIATLVLVVVFVLRQIRGLISR